MEKNLNKYKSALEFFGKDKLEKFEDELHAIQTASNISFLEKTRRLFMSPNLLLPYSIIITCFLCYRFSLNTTEKPVIKIIEKSVIAEDSQKDLLQEPIYDLQDLKINITVDEPDFLKQVEEKPTPTVTVKRGDTLSTIAQNLLKSSGIKNNYRNRKVIIAKLIDLNQDVKNDHYVRAGWKIRSLSRSNTKQLCSN